MRICLFLTFLFLWDNAALGSSNASCAAHIAQYEQQHNIPQNLLHAISLIESGKKIHGQGIVAWPWTINAHGTPYVFKTKEEAIEKVKALQAQGIHSIDVGCMQINLKHHPHAFASLEDAFDPEQNIAYAARFLKSKKEQAGNWIQAAAHYHSLNPLVNYPYQQKVLESLKAMNGSLAMQTIFQMNTAEHQGLVVPQLGHTHFSGVRGRRIPVRVRFSPYPKRTIVKKYGIYPS